VCTTKKTKHVQPAIIRLLKELSKPNAARSFAKAAKLAGRIC
jgi:hypothetical protein